MDNAAFSSTLPKPIEIGILLLDDFPLMAHASTVEPFRAANLLSQKEHYSLSYYSMDGEGVKSSGGTTVANCQPLNDANPLDMLFVIAGGDSQKIIKTPLQGRLRALAKKDILLGGVSGGPLALAAAGLLEGRRATVHWEHREAMAQISSNILLEKSIFEIDQKRLTCAGGIAALDLGHALIAQELGTGFARQVSDWFLHTEIRPAESKQKSTVIERYNTTNAKTLDAIELMQNNIADPLLIDDIANLLAVTPRHLTRLFQSELSQSPAQFYMELRLQSAKRLLQNTSLSATEIAYATGFSSSAHFSSSFKKRFHTTPSRFSTSKAIG